MLTEKDMIPATGRAPRNRDFYGIVEDAAGQHIGDSFVVDGVIKIFKIKHGRVAAVIPRDFTAEEIYTRRFERVSECKIVQIRGIR